MTADGTPQYAGLNPINISIKQSQCVDDGWETQHSKKCVQKKPRACYLGMSIVTKQLMSKHMDAFNNMVEVSIYNNIILDYIMHSIGCICSCNPIKKEFTIIPDNKYRIKIIKKNKNRIELEQWHCHYDSIMQLTPISVRKVVICI